MASTCSINIEVAGISEIRTLLARLTAVAHAARALHEAYDPDDGFCCSKDVAAGMAALGAALKALDGEN